jgi:hypothetical protein
MYDRDADTCTRFSARAGGGALRASMRGVRDDDAASWEVARRLVAQADARWRASELVRPGCRRKIAEMFSVADTTSALLQLGTALPATA